MSFEIMHHWRNISVIPGKLCRFLSNANMKMESMEQKINIRGVDINYLETGNGEHPVILIPGAMASMWSHFAPQIEKLDKTKFTIVGWDPPGCGKSRPPSRIFSEHFLQGDASFAVDLMQALGHKTFSTIGFCGGGKTAIALAALYPDCVRKLILIGTSTFITPEGMLSYENLNHSDNSSELHSRHLMKMQYDDYYRKSFNSWMEALLNLSKKQNGDVCTNFLDKIRCQTLIVQGTDDYLVNQSHAAFVNARIRHSRVHMFEKGYHSVHLEFHDEFNDLATKSHLILKTLRKSPFCYKQDQYGSTSGRKSKNCTGTYRVTIAYCDKQKSSIVAWDPPGYGNSHPPNRAFSEDIFAKDASVAHDLMKAIGFDKFSLLCWSDGGITSFFIAATYPESIEKMIVVGANAYVLPEELALYKAVRNIDMWSERMRTPMVAIYGEGYFRSTWATWVDTMAAMYEKNKGDICMNLLRDIRCPTLIVHGARYVMVHNDHPKFLGDNIKNSKVHIFENGGHTLHLKYHEEFNKITTEFLLADSNL